MKNEQSILKFCPEYAQKSLIRLGTLLWTSKLSLSAKEGNIVKHEGTGNRRGWIGVIINIFEDDGGYGILWLLDANNKKILPDFRQRADQPEISVGIFQRYSEQWPKHHIVSGKLKNFSIYEHVDKLGEEESTHIISDESGSALHKKGSFIVWGQCGKTNPSKSQGYASAVKEAKTMASKHSQVFHVARLDTKISPIVTVDTRVDYL